MKMARMLLLMFFMIVFLGINGSYAADGTFNGSYSIIASHSGKAVDTWEWGTTDGTNIAQFNYWEGDAQKFNITTVDGTWHTISPVIAYNQVVEVANGSSYAGANIQTFSNSGNASQQWRFEDAGNGTYHIINRNSNMCIDVADSSQDDGANVIQNQCVAYQASQTFKLIPHGGGTSSGFTSDTNSGFTNDTNSGFTNDANSGFFNDANSGFTNDTNNGFTNDTNSGFFNDTNNGFFNDTNSGFFNDTNNGFTNDTNSGFTNDTNNGFTNDTNNGFTNDTNSGFNGNQTVPGCGQGPQDGTVNVVCSNTPADMTSARVAVFPLQFLVQKEAKDPETGTRLGLAPMEGSAVINKRTGSSTPIVSKDNRKTPAVLSGGGHIVIVMVQKGLLDAQFSITNVRVNGDTTLNLDFNKLKPVGETLKPILEALKPILEKLNNGTQNNPANNPMS